MNVAHVHLLLNHIPVLGVLFGLIVLMFAYMTREPSLLKLGLLTLIVIALFTIPAFLTGDPASDLLEGVPGISDASVEAHEDVARLSFAVLEVLGISSAFAFWRLRRTGVHSRLWMTGILSLTIITTGLMALTALRGGEIRHSEITGTATALNSSPNREPTMDISSNLQTPAALTTEHEELHRRLSEAIQSGGKTSASARTVAELLHQHFVQEEKLAMPLLGLLTPLAKGHVRASPEARNMAEGFRKEYPAMLKEHQAILKALQQLKRDAQGENKQNVSEFADALTLHAQTEEQVLYPAALVVAKLVMNEAPKLAGSGAELEG